MEDESRCTQDSLLDLSVDAFLLRLASGAPTPGGGSASALSGALAAALLAMVCRLTLGRERFAEHATLMEQLLARAEELRLSLLEAVDRDARAYDCVVRAYRLGRSDEAQQLGRFAAIEDAMCEATRVPLSVAADCAELLQMAGSVLEHGNPNALSDGRVAVLLAQAGLRGAVYNVRINLSSVGDRGFVAACEERAAALLALADSGGGQV